MFKEIPNILTVFRIILIPILVMSFYIDTKASRYIYTGIFIFASITDYIDGLLARLWKAETNFGRMLDPIADKMLVVSTLLMLVYKGMAPVIPIVAILCREIFVSGMREYLGESKIVLPVNILGKIKTAVQMIAIIVIMIGSDLVSWKYIQNIGEISLWVAAILTIVSGFIYCREGMKHI